MSRRRNTTAPAFDVLLDLTLTPAEASRKFDAITRRWNTENRGIIAWFAMRARAIKAEAAAREAALATWADDGGRA